MTTTFTIALSTHRLESLPYARAVMSRHEAIVLEEPPSSTLTRVLEGTAAVEDYLWELDAEFPEFSRQQLAILQELWQEGRAILQVEPYLERLLAIHELFAQEVIPEEVRSREELRQVYDVEREATAALLRFYEVSLQAPFPEVVAAVQEFARRDAARFRLRDAMRAQALAALAGHYETIYVETGHMHLSLPGELRRVLAGRGKVRAHFLLGAVARQRSRRPRVFGPGDELTFAHLFRRPITPATEQLLAARSLIYIKLLGKDELPDEASPTPHLDEELRLSALVCQLSYADCAELYPLLKQAPPAQALHLVHRFLKEQGSNGRSGNT
ncbi:MAG: hypothetical protein ACUVRZ_07525 [Desulfobacca sp.]|uniref:hypothetical protein n=1 Tax=Desulfobacca sp. TaxID=2067990 RepID=UPI00404A3327